MKRKIFSNASILVILSVILSFVVTGAVMYGRILENMKETVQEECRFLSNAMTAADGDAAYLKQLCSDAASRVTLIDCEGKVAFDSEASDESMDNHGTDRRLWRHRRTAREVMSDIQAPCQSRPFIMR